MASEGSSDGRKPPPVTLRPPPDQVLKCPRCDSSNTKFCYYNNYSLTQPRHFCKTCRRYWTKGGALRNVPIGGGCRKNKKAKPGTSRLSGDPKEPDSGTNTGLKFLQAAGISSSAMDYQLNGLPFSRLHSPGSGVFNQFFSFGDLSSTVTSPTASPSVPNCSSALDLGQQVMSTPLMGSFNYPVLRQGESSGPAYCGAVPENMGPAAASVHNDIASSIESLSSINQDLHWKLQQQRLASLFGAAECLQGAATTSNVNSTACLMDGTQNQAQPISFQASESSKNGNCGGNLRKGGVGENSGEWFFENSYNVGSSTGNIGNGSSNPSNSWNEIQTWNKLHQYSALP